MTLHDHVRLHMVKKFELSSLHAVGKMSTEKPPEASPSSELSNAESSDSQWPYVVLAAAKKGKKKSKKPVARSLNDFLSEGGTKPAPAHNWADATDDIDPSGKPQ